MSKIAEIKERAEQVKKSGCWYNIPPQDVINLCDALEEAKKWIGKDVYEETVFCRIDQILESKP